MGEVVTVKWEEDRVPVVVLARLVGLAPIVLRTLCRGPWDPMRLSQNVVTSQKAFSAFQEKSRGQVQLRILKHERRIQFQFLHTSKPELIITDIPDYALHMIIQNVTHAS